MPLPVRQSVDGLLARLQLEGDEADVWVEGAFDEAVYRHCLAISGISAVAVRRVEDLEIPREFLTGVDRPGNRTRLLIVADVVERELGHDLSNFMCCIDRDDDVFAEPDYGPYAIPTDSTCLEGILWDRSTIAKVTTLFLGGDGSRVDAMLDSLEPILAELFLIRSGQHQLGLDCRLESARRLVSVDREGCSDFDREEYITRLLNSGGMADRRKDLESRVQKLRQSDTSGPGPLLNGHDLVDLLGHALIPLVPVRSRQRLAADGLSRALITGMDWGRVVGTSNQLSSLVSRLERFR